VNIFRRLIALNESIKGVRAVRMMERSIKHPNLSLFEYGVRLKGFCGIVRLGKKDADTFVTWAKKQDPINNRYAKEANTFTFGSHTSVVVMRNGNASKPNILLGKKVHSDLICTLHVSYVQLRGGTVFLSLFAAPFKDYAHKFSKPVNLSDFTFSPRLCLNPFNKSFLFMDIPNEDYEARIEIGRRFMEARDEVERLAKFIFNSIGIQKEVSNLFLECIFRYDSTNPYSQNDRTCLNNTNAVISRFVVSLDDRGISEDPAEISFTNKQTDRLNVDAFFIKSELDDAQRKGGMPTYKEMLLDFKLSHLDSSIILCLWKEVETLSITNSAPLLEVPETSRNGWADELRHLRHELTLISRAAHSLLFHFKAQKPDRVKNETECLIDYIEEMKSTVQEQSSFSDQVVSESILKSQKRQSWLMFALVIAQLLLGGFALFGPYSTADISALLGGFLAPQNP
jgi:hypothetical protein